MTRRTCSFLVSGVLTEVVQQIHSLRASGVMSSHAASAFRSAARAFCKSVGTSCATPPEIVLFIAQVYYIPMLAHLPCSEFDPDKGKDRDDKYASNDLAGTRGDLIGHEGICDTEDIE